MSYKESLGTIIKEVIEPSAVSIDREAAFPREAVKALGNAGLLGLTSDKAVGGMGLGLAQAAEVIEKIAGACASTAMIVTMHYCANALIERFGSESIRREIAAGRHLSTLAWSEAGSRSHFWAPLGTARLDGDECILDGVKSWVTSAMEADSYVWSSRPAAAGGASTLWFVDGNVQGLSSPAGFDGLGLRGNASAPMIGKEMRVPAGEMLGTDGGGFDLMIGVVLPIFAVLNASCSIGIMDATLASAIAHISGKKFEHLGSTLADLPTIRAYAARARIKADMVRTLRDDTLAALAADRADAMLRVMEVKAGASEAALEVTDIAMRICGGAAFRKEGGIERHFRDARAASVMAPTSDVLYDFIGKAICGLPLF